MRIGRFIHPDGSLKVYLIESVSQIGLTIVIRRGSPIRSFAVSRDNRRSSHRIVSGSAEIAE
jgi:hypothetical protein